jgi:outer membrane protein OmpA-like peptidoglycan-associated protein
MAAAAEEPPPALPRGAQLPAAPVTYPDAAVTFPDAALTFTTRPLVTTEGQFGMPGVDMRAEGTGWRFTLGTDVLFDFDRAELRPEAGLVLKRLVAEVDARLPGRRISYRVEGHTDWIGSDAYNQRLSQRRAASVRQWPVTQGGIAGATVQTIGFGESRPAAPNAHPDGRDDPGGRQRNRRVEILVAPR